jgi:AcrR family transcriptional regulator
MSTSHPADGQDTYHHGDLRNALIAAGVALLGEQSVESISLRGLAKRAGVSHNAPYQHFADKDALMAAIAEEGFHLLSQAIDASQVGLEEAGGIERLVRAGQSYVSFALDHPGHFQVMFSRRDGTYPMLSVASRAAFERLRAIVAAGQSTGELRPEPPEATALTVWMIVHGLSNVVIAEKLPPGVTSLGKPVELAGDLLRHTCRGLAR